MPQKDILLLIPYMHVGVGVIGLGYLYFYVEHAYMMGFTKNLTVIPQHYNIITLLCMFESIKALNMFKYS